MTRTIQVMRADGSADAPGPVTVFDSQGRAKLNVWSGDAADGHVLTADGSGGSDWEDPAETPSGAHASTHENDGSDEIDVTDLSGLLADEQTPVDHDHSGDVGDGGTFDAVNLTSGAATDGQVLTADGAGGAAWEDVAGSGDVTWAAIQASQLVNEFKGFPSAVGIDVDLDAANQWWDKVGTPSTAVTMVDVAGEGITEIYEYALKTVTDAASEGLSQTWTYADEPRVKGGRTLSVICAIWSVSSLSVTARLVNSDASETAASAVTAAAWTIVKVENHILAGTSCTFQVTAGAAGTFYVVPLGACIGEKAVPLAPRGLKYIDKKVAGLVEGVDAGGNWTDLDLTAATSPLACIAHLSCRYLNSSAANTSLLVRRNGDTGVIGGHIVTRNASTSAIAQAQAVVALDDAQICEYVGAAAANVEAIYIYLVGYWEWA